MNKDKEEDFQSLWSSVSLYSVSYDVVGKNCWLCITVKFLNSVGVNVKLLCIATYI